MTDREDSTNHGSTNHSVACRQALALNSSTQSRMNVTRTKPRRSDLSPDQILCDFCTAKCCRYFALPIDTPATYEDFQYIRWYLLHDAAYVFVEDGTWYLLVQTECKHLRPDNRCGIYKTRPTICSEYSTDDCEYEDNWTYDRYFETAEQVQEYCEARFSRPGETNFRSPRPELLPIIETGAPGARPLLPISSSPLSSAPSPNKTV
jgi:Fe-S-cluster containining protein